MQVRPPDAASQPTPFHPSDDVPSEAGSSEQVRIDWLSVIPFAFMHLACFGVLWTGWSWVAVAVAAAMYAVRMFAITAFYHRYFSHRAFSTNRFWQFAFGVLGASAVQRGPLWWAAHHRNHHQHSDEAQDPHSPVQRGFWWSHLCWFLTHPHETTNVARVRDLAKFPELRLLDRYCMLVAVAAAVGIYSIGAVLEKSAPSLGTTGWQMLVWGFFISTVVLYHATYTINSLAHRFGSRRYETRDDSRNNWALAILTFGEGWHNNHHRFPGSARQGFFWWEVDLSYYVLRLLSAAGVVWNLRPVPAEVLSGSDSTRRIASES